MSATSYSRRWLGVLFPAIVLVAGIMLLSREAATSAANTPVNIASSTQGSNEEHAVRTDNSFEAMYSVSLEVYSNRWESTGFKKVPPKNQDTNPGNP